MILLITWGLLWRRFGEADRVVYIATRFDKEISNGRYGNPTITISQLVEEGNIVVAEGTVKCKLKNGGFIDALFCEVFHFDNGKVKKLTTYHIEKKKA